MAKTAKTHKKTVKPSYQAEEGPDPLEEKTSSSSAGSMPTDAGESAEEKVAGTASGSESSEMSEGGSDVEYDTDLGTAIPRDEGVLEPVAPKNAANLDFGKMPKFRSRVGRDRAEKVIRKYPFRLGYLITSPGPNDSTAKPPMRTVAIYLQQLEAGLRMPPSRVFRDVLRYFTV